MLYIKNPSMDPSFNQALEEYVFEHFEEDVLLIWRNEPTVVCGKYQNIFAEVDVLAAQKNQVALIRRITGGGTVYHDPGNINYSFIRHTDSQEINYAAYLAPIMRALGSFGVDSEIITGNGIAVSGKKVSGSAQRIAKGKVLHHGTLLYDCDLTALRNLANGARSYYTSKGTQSVPWPVTNLRDFMPDGGLTAQAFEKALLANLDQQFGLERVELSQRALQEIDELARSRYRSWEWTFGANPAFLFLRDFRFRDTDYHLKYSSDEGIVEEFTLHPEVPGLDRAMAGRRLQADELKKTLAEFPGFEDLIRFIL